MHSLYHIKESLHEQSSAVSCYISFLTVSFVDLQEVPDLVKHILDEVETSSEHLAGCMEQVGELTFPSVIQCFPKRVGTVSLFLSPNPVSIGETLV